MSYICETHTVGYHQGGDVFRTGPLREWGEIFDLGLKPETFERASGLLTRYAEVTQDPELVHHFPDAFIPDENHPRYGLSDDHFWLQNGDKWALVKTPIDAGSWIFKETKLIV